MANIYDKIEDYLNGFLSEGERTEFKQKLEDDPAFKETYELRKSMFLLLKHKQDKETLKKKLSDISNSSSPTITKAPPKRLWLKYAMAAASVLILVLALTQLLKSDKSLYEKYAFEYTMNVTQKSDENTLNHSQTAFNKGDYTTAYTSLNTYLKDNPKDITAYYSLGICALELDKYDEALEVFNNINSGTSAYKKNTEWLIALTYLKAGDLVKCKKALSEIPPSNTWHEKAQKLLSEIDM